MARTNNAHLPDANELSSILDTEAVRDVPTSNISLHFPDFTAIENILAHFDITSDLFTNNRLDIHQAVRRGDELIQLLIERILHNPDKQAIQLLDAAYEYLSEQDVPKPSDVIFVFGSKTSLRAEKAAELYKAELGKKIMVSGGSPIYASADAQSEASLYKQLLIEKGISAGAIITEQASITVPDNVRSSLNLLDTLDIHPTSIVLVNSPYSQRRGWAIFKKFLDQSVTLYRVNSACGPEYQKENWYKQEHTVRVVLNEYIKMRASVLYNNA